MAPTTLPRVFADLGLGPLAEVVADGRKVTRCGSRSRTERGGSVAVSLDALRIGRDASQIAQEIVQHLSGLVGAKVEVTLEIQAQIPDGVPDHIVRTVAENCRTLRFTTHGFEEE